MRYRALSPSGDYTFGQGVANFLVNTPACVGQAVQTRLRLLTKEWFLDLTDGTPYDPDVEGKNTASTRDLAIKNRVLKTPGVTGISAYRSTLVDRNFAPQLTIDTIYGSTDAITVPLP